MRGATPDPPRTSIVVGDLSVTLRNVFRQPSHYAKNCGTFPVWLDLLPDRPGGRGRRPPRQPPRRHDAVGDRPWPGPQPGDDAPDARQPAARRVDRPAPHAQDLPARARPRDGRPDRRRRLLGHRRVPPGARRAATGAAAAARSRSRPARSRAWSSTSCTTRPTPSGASASATPCRSNHRSGSRTWRGRTPRPSRVWIARGGDDPEIERRYRHILDVTRRAGTRSTSSSRLRRNSVGCYADRSRRARRASTDASHGEVRDAIERYAATLAADAAYGPAELDPTRPTSSTPCARPCSTTAPRSR